MQKFYENRMLTYRGENRTSLQAGKLPNAERYNVVVDKKTGAILRTLKTDKRAARGHLRLIQEEDLLFKKINGIGGIK